jgi:hypothetical protein
MPRVEIWPDLKIRHCFGLEKMMITNSIAPTRIAKLTQPGTA